MKDFCSVFTLEDAGGMLMLLVKSWWSLTAGMAVMADARTHPGPGGAGMQLTADCSNQPLQTLLSGLHQCLQRPAAAPVVETRPASTKRPPFLHSLQPSWYYDSSTHYMSRGHQQLTVPSDGPCTSGTSASAWPPACGRWPRGGPPSSPSPTDTSPASARVAA